MKNIDIKIYNIRSQKTLQHFLKKIAPLKQICIDIEMNNTHFYKPIICLIQIALQKDCYLIDTLTPIKLDLFFKAIQSKKLIFHGCDYDIRCLYSNYNFVPSKIFDTMLAGKFLNQNNLGLSSVVENKFGLKLDKQYQRENWNIRPLPKKMQRYAALDSYFLSKIYTSFNQDLKQNNRLDWLNSYLDKYIKHIINQENNKSKTHNNVKGLNKLSPIQKRIFEVIWLWREEIAEKKDIHSGRILHLKQIFKLASFFPYTKADKKTFQTYWTKVKSYLSQKKISLQLLKVLQEKENCLKKKPPVLKKKNIESKNSQRIKLLKESRNRLAKKHNISHELLCSLDVIKHLSKKTNFPVTKKQYLDEPLPLLYWQKEILTNSWLRLFKQFSRQQT